MKRVALRDVNHPPADSLYRVALFANGKVGYIRIGTDRHALDNDDPLARLSRSSVKGVPVGWAWSLPPEDLATAESLAQDGLLVKGIRKFTDTKEIAFKYRNMKGEAGKWKSPSDIPDAGTYFDYLKVGTETLDVDIKGKVIDLDTSWKEYMTRRPSMGPGPEKSYVIPSGDVSFTGHQTDLLKILGHLLQVDRRITPDFKVVNAERYRGKTIADVLGESRDVDVALGQRQKGQIKPFFAFHGTSKLRWETIQKTGLIPNKQGKVYVDLIPDYSDKNVYFAFSPEVAENYAARQAIWDKSAAVVLKVAIRDPDRLVADEDMMGGWYNLEHTYFLTDRDGELIKYEKGSEQHIRVVLEEYAKGRFKKDDQYLAFFQEFYVARKNMFLKKSLTGGTFGYRGRIPARDVKLFMEFARKPYPSGNKLDFDTYQRIRKEVQNKAKRPQEKDQRLVQRVAQRWLYASSGYYQPGGSYDDTTDCNRNPRP